MGTALYRWFGGRGYMDGLQPLGVLQIQKK
jgi:hypothetical protein